VAALVALLASGLAGAATSNAPGGPFFWFAAGTLAFWLFRARSGPAAEPVGSKLRPIEPPLALPPALPAARIAPSASATRIRIVCGPRRSEVDGIRDYADRLASSLAEEG